MGDYPAYGGGGRPDKGGDPVSYVPTPSFVALADGVPVRLKVVGAQEVVKEITDPETLQRKTITALELQVSHVNGQARATVLDLVSFKVQSALAPYINSREIYRRTLEITRRGSGRRTEYEVRLL